MTSKQDWWRGSVTYQIYPRSFMDSDGDGIGDLKGITERLDHIAALGVDAIWLSPVFPSPMADMGYDVSDYCGIDPTFGTMDDFDAMLDRAHALGLKVIIDQVLSHASDQHPFFVESRQSRDNPKADWFVWADPKPDGTPPNNWLAIFGGASWEWDARRRQYYFHNFLREQPDWNFHNPEVQDYLLDCVRFWLDRGVDGFRLDTVNFYVHDKMLRDNAANPLPWAQQAVRPFEMQYTLFSKNQPENIAFLERLRALLDEYDERTMVGEVGDSHHSIDLMGEYTSGSKRLHMAYSFELLGPDFSPGHFRSRIEAFFKGAPDGWPCWAFSNHDVPRHVGRWLDHSEDQDELAKQAAALLLSFEGSICIYQGEELGQVDTVLTFEELTDPEGINFWPEKTGRDGCRTPMVWDRDAPNGGFSKANRTWLPIKPPQQARAVSTQGENSVLAFYKEMLALRRAEADLRDGKTVFLDFPEPVLGFRRGDDMVCIYNLSATPISVELPIDIRSVLDQAAAIEGRALHLGANGFVIGRVS
ncbi:alpha-amylase family glycosyl hydrolase [Nioella ostreopsis]|uniref:alpha-amylase family glycosyl hydrolase n=1 Tax=Nioella ostreopsis TaxID=2448479 RepID=UPI000FDA89A7|nr:alpha-amylase family glycosyl hydrolase [Nioella ostreopsis]